MKEKIGKHTFRLPPCPAYDIEGMESWLSDLAMEGLFLTEEGFFGWIGHFVYDTPRPARYRLEAARKSTSMWAENYGDPDWEEVELSKQYTWEYVAKRGDFYIYRSFDETARELHTDPQVQAMALDAVKSRQKSAILQQIFWLIVYPLLFFRSGILLMMITVRTWLFLLTVFFVVWMLADGVITILYLRKLQKRLLSGRLSSGKINWKGRSGRHFTKCFTQICIAGILVVAYGSLWSDTMLDKNLITLDQYEGTVPFATMADFHKGNVTDYERTMLGMSFNTIQEWSDWLAPRCVDFEEQVRIHYGDGKMIDGGYYVEYFELANDTLARWLVQEYYGIDRHKEDYAPLETPELSVDFAAAYASDLHLPVILIRDGNIVLRAYFYQTVPQGKEIPKEQWMTILAQSIGKEHALLENR